MAKYLEQIETTKAANMASRAISDASILKLDEAWDRMDAGEIDITQFHTEVRGIVRFAYRESAQIGKKLTQTLSGIDGWNPSETIRDTEYLKSLLTDVKRNVDAFKKSGKTDADRRKLKLRLGLSAITASTRGLTDAQISHYSELKDMGYKLQKMWLANFANNEPCADCVALHGTRVPFENEFPIPTLMRTAVYRDLQGPPLHVRCKCTMVILITTLENLLDVIPRESADSIVTMSTKTVKKLPQKVFDAVIKVLRMITGRRANG